MKRQTSTSCRQKGTVAGAAILSIALVTSGVSRVYAGDPVDPNTPDQLNPDRAVTDEQRSSPKTRDEAQAQLNADTKDLEGKAQAKDEAQKALELAQKDVEDKTAASKKAHDDAESAFTKAHTDADAAAQSASEKVVAAQENKTQADTDLASKAEALTSLEEAKATAEAAFNEENTKAEAQGLSLQKLEAAKAELDAAQTQLEQKTAAVENAQTAKQAATDALEQANNAQAAAETAKHKAEEDKAAAEASLQEANAKLTEATEALDALKTSETEQNLQGAQELKTQAEQALTAAQGDLEAKKAILATKTVDLEAAEQAKSAAIQAKADADASLVQAKSDLETAKNTVATKQAAYDAFTDPIAQATDAKATAETEKSQEQEGVTEKQKAVETAQGEVDSARTALEEAQKLAEGAVDNSAKLLEGAFAYFEHVVEQGGEDAEDAAQALKILKESPLHEAVQKGNPLSATAVENMLKTLEFIDRSNELRASEIEDADLKVSHTLMAMAMVKADWAATHTDSSSENFGAYYNGENVTKGGEDPFSWFDNEKNIFTLATVTEGVDPESPATYEGWAESVAPGQEGQEHPLTNRDRVHRYVTLMDLDTHNTGSKLESLSFYGTGFGVSKLNPENQTTYVQDFATDPLTKGQGSADAAIAGEQPKPLHLMTSEVYRTALNTWKDSLQAGSATDIEAKQAALTAANERLEVAKANLQTAQQTLEQKEAAVVQKTSGLQELERQQADALAELNAAKQADTEAQTKHDTIEGSIAGLETAVADKTREAQEAQDAKDTAQHNVDGAEGVKTRAEGDLEAKTQAFNEAKTAHDQYLEQKNQAEETKATAEADVLAKTNAVSKAEEAVRLAQTELDSALADVTAKTNEKTTAENALTAAENEKNTATDDVVAKQNAYDTMKRDLAALIAAKEQLDSATEALSEAAKARDEAQAAVVDAQNALEAAQAQKDTADARKATLDAVVFNGALTPVVGDAELDALIDALKLAEGDLATSQTAFDQAKATLDAAVLAHKDALAKVVQDQIILDSFRLKVIDGDGQKEFIGNKVSFRINHDLVGFSVVKVDGVVVDSAHYDVSAGSTLVALIGSYTETLAEGNHFFEGIYDNGAFAQASFSLIQKPSVDASSTKDKPTSSSQKKAKAPKHAAVPQTSDAGFIASLTTALLGAASLSATKRSRKEPKHLKK